ncbi:MAG: DUF1207 domain-containing protein [Planctomycetota bacterium]|nr:MAG: DUF1207 domain-containing protein [Planctomycetota bacterium]
MKRKNNKILFSFTGALFFEVLFVLFSTTCPLWAKEFNEDMKSIKKNTSSSASFQATWELFTDEPRAFAPILANPREANIRLGFMLDNKGKSFWDLGFGGDLGLLSYKSPNWFFIATVRGLVAPRFAFFSKSFDLLNTDFLGGVAFGLKTNSWGGEVFVYHQSSHLGDEILSRGERKRIDYSRETFQILIEQYFFSSLRVYSGLSYHIRALPASLEGRFTIHGGGEYYLKKFFLPVFLALDMQAHQFHQWEPNISLQIGVELGNPMKVLKRQRLFFELYYGFSNMGQYYNERKVYILMGIGYNF